LIIINRRRDGEESRTIERSENWRTKIGGLSEERKKTATER
jgi:hypothetical protein